MIPRIALRNIFRNKWRTALTAGGIAVATLMLIWITGFTDAFILQMVRGATAVKTGQILVQHPDYAERASLFKHFAIDDAMLADIEAVEGVEGAAPRIYAFGLVGTEKHSQAAQLVGVSPTAEARTTLLDDSIIEGRWLANTPPEFPAPREVVVGKALAKQLGVGLGDVDGDGLPDNELVLSSLLAADGSLGNDLFTVVGIIKSGNTEVDRLSLFVHIDDLGFTAALEGRAHEIAIATRDVNDLDDARDAIASIVSRHDQDSVGLLTRDWKTFNKTLYEMLELSSGSIAIMYFILFAIAGLGILNTQRMSALERKREFGVLLAIGLKPRQLGLMITLEAAILTLVGGLIGALLGAALTGYFASAGFDMAAMSDTGGDFTYMGVAFNEPVYFPFELGSLLLPVFVVTLMGGLFGLWPAIQSARLNAIQAISGRI